MVAIAVLAAGGWAACGDSRQGSTDGARAGDAEPAAPATAPASGAAGAQPVARPDSPATAELPAVRVLLDDVAAEPPSWSPDGSRIVVDDYDTFGLRIVPSTGGVASPLTEEPLHNEPDWSRASGLIAFVDKAKGAISVIAPGGGPARAVARGAIEGYDAPWSPDGKELLFQQDGGLAVVGVASGVIRILVPASGGGSPVVSARWSPDGKRIIAQRRREIVIVRADGGSEQIVPGLEGLAPALGKDGTIWVIGGGPARPLLYRLGDDTKEAGGLEGPVSSFDIDPGSGRLAAAVKGRGIFVLPAGGGEPSRLTDGAGDRSPRWSPDGSAVAFVRPGGKNGLQLCVVDVRRDLP